VGVFEVEGGGKGQREALRRSRHCMVSQHTNETGGGGERG
jgi:hypothetical protein